MRRIRTLAITLTLLGVLLLAPATAAAEVPPPAVASYTIQVTYLPDSQRLVGEEVVRYTNVTDTPIPDLVFHLYLNAFESAETVWMQEAGYSHRGYSFNPQEAGHVDVHSLVLGDGTELEQEYPYDDETLMRVALPEPVAPGETVVVEVAFEAQLPRVFARTGWADEGEFVMVGQWFPKLGVWEGEEGWNAYVFHANSEFYADFGTYQVEITLPEGWVVGATGAEETRLTGDPGTVTYVYSAENVIDFAWSASPNFEEYREQLGNVSLRILHYPEQGGTLERVRDATVGAFQLYETWYGEYGRGLYDQLTVIIVPPDAGGAGGMEYPQLFTVGVMGGYLPGCVRLTEVETVHELGHQWFQSVVATNEAEDPWLDEGFTDYVSVRAMESLYGNVLDCLGWELSYLAMRRAEYVQEPQVTMAGRAWDLDAYSIATYSKPAIALTTLQQLVGEEAMLDFMQSYYERYAFAHPDTEDVREVMAESLSEGTAAWFFEQLVYGDGTFDAYVDALEGNEGAVERRGELCVPSEVQWQYAESPPIDADWACEEPELDFTGSDPLVGIQINPEEKPPLDLNHLNDELQEAPDLGVWLGLVVRALDVFQGLFLTGGGLW